MRLNNYFLVWKEVFGKWQYFLIGLIIALVFFLVNVLIAQKSLNLTAFYYIVTRFTFHSMILISLLTGMLITLISYKYKIVKESGKDIGILASLGILVGLLVPGCASCGIGLAAALGLGGSITSLPFKGIEISLIAIILLIVSIFMITGSFIECDIKIRKKK